MSRHDRGWARERLERIEAAAEARALPTVEALAVAVIGNGWLVDGRCRYCSRLDPEHRGCPIPAALAALAATPAPAPEADR